ncbi:hypothetical protein GCM10017559_84790 [Streptosporangium longisporum]|uniref:MbtH-like domain-containing protein n=1 Tax=Streptosporangium longisporum TaxID=46187 RepID=A0ABP6L9M9_9ACTN
MWPAFADVPAGWEVAHAEDSRAGCLSYVESSWADMRPRSLVARMEG